MHNTRTLFDPVFVILVRLVHFVPLIICFIDMCYLLLRYHGDIVFLKTNHGHIVNFCLMKWLENNSTKTIK